jgi:hypothetical protein
MVWLTHLAEELCGEFEFRRKKAHASARLLPRLKELIREIPNGNFSCPPQCMPEIYKNSNVVTAYRSYYINEKKFDKRGSRMDIWFPREKPDWYN